jgi:hypothetical protein
MSYAMRPMPSPRGTNRAGLFLPSRSGVVLAMDAKPAWSRTRRPRLGYDDAGAVDPREPGDAADPFEELTEFLAGKLSSGDLDQVKQYLAKLRGDDPSGTPASRAMDAAPRINVASLAARIRTL